MRTWLLLAFGAAVLPAQLIDGPGRAEVMRNCRGCHEVERSISKRQDRNGWAETIVKMTGLGMKANDGDLSIIMDYLTRYYPADALPPVNINTAKSIELESRLSLRRSQAAAVLAYRAQHGPFKKFADLAKVGVLDLDKLADKQDRIVYE